MSKWKCNRCPTVFLYKYKAWWIDLFRQYSRCVAQENFQRALPQIIISLQEGIYLQQRRGSTQLNQCSDRPFSQGGFSHKIIGKQRPRSSSSFVLLLWPLGCVTGLAGWLVGMEFRSFNSSPLTYWGILKPVQLPVDVFLGVTFLVWRRIA